MTLWILLSLAIFAAGYGLGREIHKPRRDRFELPRRSVLRKL